MRVRYIAGLAERFRPGVTILATVSLSVIATVLVQHLGASAAATAPPGQLPEVRASTFVLVGPGGTELARLEPGHDGNARLQMFDASGTLRLGLAAQGALNVFDTDGTTQRFRAGYVPYVDGIGRPPINGVWLDADGSVSVVSASPPQR